MKSTTSPKAIAANRLNATKSTGPQTVQGKKRCGGNALTHGLCSREILLKGESREELEELREGLRAQLQPVGDLEEVLVDRIVSLAWRLRRATRIEKEAMQYFLDWDVRFPRRRRSYDDDERRSLGEAVATDLMEENNTCLKLMKYETSIERSFYKTLHELERLQAARRGQPVVAPIAIDVDART